MWKKWQVRKVQTWNSLLFTIQAHEKLIIYHVLYICVQIWKLRKRVSFFVNWWVKKNKTSESFQFHGRLSGISPFPAVYHNCLRNTRYLISFLPSPSSSPQHLFHLLPRSKKSKIQSFLNLPSVSSLYISLINGAHI